MSAVSEIVGHAAPPHTFTHRGKTYTLQLIDDRLNVAWERKQLAKAREFEKGNKDAGLYTPAEFSERLNLLSKRYHDGEFSLFRWMVENGPAFDAVKEKGVQAATGELADGVILLASLIFQCDKSEVILLLKERGAEIGSLLRLIADESLDTKKNGEASAEGGAPNA